MEPRLLYERQVNRLEHKLEACAALERLHNWARVAVFAAGVAAAWALGSLFGAQAAWISLGVAGLFFAAVVLHQRRLERKTRALRTWLAIYQEKLARLALDWEHIPLPAGMGAGPASPLAADLDLWGPTSLHHLLDCTIFRQGSARLAGWLAAGVPTPAHTAFRQGVVRELAGASRFRNRLRLLFHQVSREPLDDEKMLDWLQAPLNEARLGRMLPWATLLVAANLALFFLNMNGVLPSWWVLTLLAYAGLYLVFQQQVGAFLTSVIRLDAELNRFRRLLRFLETFRYAGRPSLEEACRPFLPGPEGPGRLLRRLQVVTALAGLRMNAYAWLPLNLLLPWDFWAAWLAARQRRRMAERLPAWLEAFHELEALVSLGEFAALHPQHAFPEFLPQGAGGEAVLQARLLGHPLLPEESKVRNDLRVERLGELLIITGSNMAGKSTFLRTVGVNLCLAHAGGPVDAAGLRTLPFRLYTCIRISDSIGEGISYFYAEVKRLKGLLEALGGDGAGLPLLYLVDEIYRGTNNRERLLGSRALVRRLVGTPGVGLIATHDLELAALEAENPQARNLHFRDEAAGGKLAFDYLLRPGPCPTTNALKIMAMEGLPVDGDEKGPGGAP